MSATGKRATVFLSIILAIGFVYYFNEGISNEAQTWKFDPPEQPDVLKRKSLTTDKGQVSYYTINEEVFKPNGFEIISASEPVPLLKNTKPKTCNQIFSSWLDIALKYNPPSSPPESIPPELIPEFTMNGHAIFTKGYYNEMAKPMPKTWDQIPAWLKLDPSAFSTYGAEGMSVLHSMKYMNVTGMNGIVIGSQRPWVEVIALQNGVNSLLTVEYQTTTILGESRVKWVHPYEYAKNWKERGQFDFAVSFSSIEHSGLQRYGDPRDPIGDIREVQKVWCMLKKGGIFFLGLPRGQDQLVYNAHRIYGRIRLAMMFNGFELLHVFRFNNPQPFQLKNEDFTIANRVIQDIFVLRKL